MIIDLTTRVERQQIEQWLNKQENRHIATGHIGTHLDTYCKTDIPLEYFRCKGILIDVSDFCETRAVTLEDLEDVNIEANSFVLFRTARIERYNYGSIEYFFDHPQLSHELIEWLTKQRIRFIGIDCAGIRRGTEHAPADILCEQHGVYVIENLCNLQQLKTKDFTVYTMWLDDPEMTGLKCRVIADMN